VDLCLAENPSECLKGLIGDFGGVSTTDSRIGQGVSEHIHRRRDTAEPIAGKVLHRETGATRLIAQMRSTGHNAISCGLAPFGFWPGHLPRSQDLRQPPRLFAGSQQVSTLASQRVSEEPIRPDTSLRGRGGRGCCRGSAC